jgi:hypothetical protein
MVHLDNSNVFLTITSGLEAWVCDQHNSPTSETSKVNKADFELKYPQKCNFTRLLWQNNSWMLQI